MLSQLLELSTPQNAGLLYVVCVMQGGAIKLYKELAYPLCNYELLLFSLGGADGKTLPLCPFCFNNPLEGAAGKVHIRLSRILSSSTHVPLAKLIMYILHGGHALSSTLRHIVF
jgi:hypothetical protein